jgi:hypothetical protein
MLKMYTVSIGLFFGDIVIGWDDLVNFKVLDVFFVIAMEQIEMIRIDIHKIEELLIE